MDERFSTLRPRNRHQVKPTKFCLIVLNMKETHPMADPMAAVKSEIEHSNLLMMEHTQECIPASD
ncbi:unnamed protein product [Clavelina lepadiformis]|uniref:Uncharacterized protein n=1 Tax=Clavelina lepadiformis TaxID=159417 RepID=A0ABP0GH45_CLALP